MKNFGAQNMVATLKRVLMKKPQPFMSKVDPQKWHYIAPLNQRLINENYNEFYQIIKNSGGKIITPTYLENYEFRQTVEAGIKSQRKLILKI